MKCCKYCSMFHFTNARIIHVAISFNNLPSDLQSMEVAELNGMVVVTQENETVDSCGSRKEVSNDPSLGTLHLLIANNTISLIVISIGHWYPTPLPQRYTETLDFPMTRTGAKSVSYVFCYLVI